MNTGACGDCLLCRHTSHNLCPFKWGGPIRGGGWLTIKKFTEKSLNAFAFSLSLRSPVCLSSEPFAGVNHTWHYFRSSRGVKARSVEWKLGRELFSISRLVALWVSSRASGFWIQLFSRFYRGDKGYRSLTRVRLHWYVGGIIVVRETFKGRILG